MPDCGHCSSAATNAYKAGIAGPFRPLNEAADRCLEMIELPLVFMDANVVEGEDGYLSFKALFGHLEKIGGVIGVLFLAEGMRLVSGGSEGVFARWMVVRIWILIYAFVGSQVAWTLRPFIGAPSMPFELFRPLGGNFYTNIFASIGEILGFFTVR